MPTAAEYRLGSIGSRVGRELDYIRMAREARAHEYEMSGEYEALELIETVGPAFAFGVLRARYGDGVLNIAKSQQKNADGSLVVDANGNPVYDPTSGVPIALILGALGHIASYSSASEGYEAHMRNIGDGLLAVAAVQLGEKIGKKWADSAASSQGQTLTTKGAYGGMHGGDSPRLRELAGNHMTPEERAAFYAAQIAQAA